MNAILCRCLETSSSRNVVITLWRPGCLSCLPWTVLHTSSRLVAQFGRDCIPCSPCATCKGQCKRWGLQLTQKVILKFVLNTSAHTAYTEHDEYGQCGKKNDLWRLSFERWRHKNEAKFLLCWWFLKRYFKRSPRKSGRNFSGHFIAFKFLNTFES